MLRSTSGDVVEHHFGLETLGVRLHARHQVGPWTPSLSPGQLSTSVVVMS